MKVWVSSGYYETEHKKRWVDTSHKVEGGHWEEKTEKVWISSYDIVPYVDYEWIDTSHLVKKYRTVTKWVGSNLTIYVGTSSYGWSVYSFAAKRKADVIIKYKGERYKAQKWVIDYKPSYGGQVYAIKYICYQKEEEATEAYYVWEESGYWKPVTAYKKVDTSHWQTKITRYWVDESYIADSGYWEYYDENKWVDTSHYENKLVWIEDGYFSSPLHGILRITKNPKYIFTGWHLNEDNKNCSMDLVIEWELDNGSLLPGEERKEITGIYIYQDIVRFGGKGTEKIDILSKNINPSPEGRIRTNTVFKNAGNEDSAVHILLYGKNGERAHIWFSNPINGFRSINLSSSGSMSGTMEWLGGNSYGEITF